jgi:hypothetical protein
MTEYCDCIDACDECGREKRPDRRIVQLIPAPQDMMAIFLVIEKEGPRFFAEKPEAIALLADGSVGTIALGSEEQSMLQQEAENFLGLERELSSVKDRTLTTQEIPVWAREAGERVIAKRGTDR